MDNNEPKDGPVLIQKFYTAREIANIAEVKVQKIRNIITYRPHIDAKKKIMDGHIFFDRETTLDIIMEIEKQKQKKEDQEENAAEPKASDEMEKVKTEKRAKELDKARTKRKTDPVYEKPPAPGPNELQAIRERKSKVDDFNVTPSAIDHTAPAPEKPKKDYAFEEERRGRTIQPCPAHTGKYCPKATSCPWWVEKVRGSDQGACSVKVAAVALDEIAFGDEIE